MCGTLFQMVLTLTDKTVRPKVVRLKGTSQSPLAVVLMVVPLDIFSLMYDVQRYLKILKLSKLKILYFCKMRQR